MMRLIPETYFLAPEQLLLFGGACLMGIPAGLLLDAFRILRVLFPHHALAVALEDMILCVLWAFMLLGFTYAFARGEFRMYYAAGMFLGLVLYEVTLGVWLLRLLRMLGRKRFAPICRKKQTRFGKTSEK